jgi:hypothetical protein
MRIRVVVTVFAFGLFGCHKTTAYLNGDELISVSSTVPKIAPCNDIEQKGNDVDLSGSRDTAPTPAGGTIEDGTYVLTSSTLHTKEKPHGAKLVAMGKITMVVKGATTQMVRSTPNGRERRTTVSRESSGSEATLHTTCASPSSTSSEPESKVTTGYTATSKSFQFITPGPAGTVVSTYTKL